MTNTIKKLRTIFDQHKNDRICVVGGTCVGKSTLLRAFPSALDMDKIVFPKLTPQEYDDVCQTPWTPEIGKRMRDLTRKYVVISPGNPVFGTVILPCDLIVHLTIDDATLRARAQKRNVNFKNAKNMQKSIEEELLTTPLPRIDICVG